MKQIIFLPQSLWLDALNFTLRQQFEGDLEALQILKPQHVKEQTG